MLRGLMDEIEIVKAMDSPLFLQATSAAVLHLPCPMQGSGAASAKKASSLRSHVLFELGDLCVVGTILEHV